jgi:Ca2+-binding EF-hand superfamily protein
MLQDAVKMYRIPVTKDVLDYFFNLADTSKDGNIDYHEFYAVFHAHIPSL